jgi:Autographiviridae endonuclease VII
MPYADKEKQREYWRKYQRSEKSKAYKRSHSKANRPKLAEQQRARIAKDPQKYKTYFRNLHIKKTYGITGEQYDVAVAAQDGKCAICGRMPNGENHVEQRLVIDHDHETGDIRGLLCNNCNSGMGIIGDSEEHLQAALDYLVRYRKRKEAQDGSGIAVPRAPDRKSDAIQLRRDEDLQGQQPHGSR